VSALASETLRFGDGHSGDTHGLETFLDVIELEGLQDSYDEFH
jgi:hypothetical protein